MNIIDLTKQYKEKILNLNDLKSYEKSYPSLFSHYFKYWAQRKYFSKKLSWQGVLKRKKIILKSLDKIEKILTKNNFNIRNLKVILFVGQNTSNGHSFFDNNEFVVWLPIEGYETKLQADVFILHEIIHALHYKNCPDFYFNNISEKRSISRQIITEGIATYLSMKLLKTNDDTALWADYISKNKTKKWNNECEKRTLELYKFVLKNYNSSNKKIGLFYASNSDDILNYRAGYYIGLNLIENVVENLKIKDIEILKLPRKKLEIIIKQELIQKTKIPEIINVGFHVDEPKLWAINNIPVEEISISEIDYNLDIPYLEQEGTDDWNLTPRMLINNFEKEKPHAKKVEQADIKYPIELYLFKNKWIILDGVHRFTKAVKLGYKTIKVRKISHEIAELTKRR